MRAVLADDQTQDRSAQFVVPQQVNDGLFGASGIRTNDVYSINSAAFTNPDAYIKIYSAIATTE